MVLGLILSVLAASPTTTERVYEWVDAKGQLHFTNVVSAIPVGVRPRELVFEVPFREGVTESVEPSPAAKPDVASTSDELNRCEAAQQEVDQLTQQLKAEQERVELDQQRQYEACQAVLNTQGQGAWARCRAADGEPASFGGPTQELDGARETLRRVQLEGCR